ncbi:hypothetical protein [Apibacter sp. HY039]|uniref:hypothetical protein n=1 Tax=Apibacter sp. HY039 TaxID=2501476 RepID=UPI000FEB7566|nr:hypothetical protein [Apibacter sp. HY039]
MYKKIVQIFTLLSIFIVLHGNAQISAFSKIDNNLSDSNYFLDASLMGLKVNRFGKLLGFPRANLTQFTFITLSQDLALVNEYYFDGVLAFNSGTGKTMTNQGKIVNVSPGFYYFSNPTAASLNSGQWKRLGGQDIVDKTEMVTNLAIDDNQVFSFKGSFTADGSTTLITLSDLPADTASAITTLYRVTIYNKDKKLFTNTVFSFDAANRQIITGAPNVSVVYEAGNYNYVLEYLK